jgi:hypothetical protein
MHRFLMFTLCFGVLTGVHTANAQTVSDWIARPVEAKTEAEAKQSKRRNIGQTNLKLRSARPNAESQNLKTTEGKCVPAQSLSADTPTLNGIVIGACCDCNRILLDGFMIYPNATLQLFNSTPNTVVPVTLGHAGPGRIGFSLSLEGPYSDELTFNVTTNSSGNGSLVITFYIKGLDVGQSNMVTTVSSGSTNPVPQMEVFACQCPPVTPVP